VRFPLRLRIVLFTVLPLVTLAIAALWTVNRSITAQVHRSLRDDLRRASAMFENMLGSRARALQIQGEVIARDPKFFSVLTLPGGYRDPQLRATVVGVARDFATLTGTDLFEVLDAEGRVVASVGPEVLGDETRRPLVMGALGGRPAYGPVVERDAQYQVSVTPVRAGGRTVGALLLGARIGTEMAEQLRAFTRSEVTFVSNQTPTVSTLEHAEDRAALVRALARLDPQALAGTHPGTVLEVRSADDAYLTLARVLPQTGAAARQCYVMQRSLRDEGAFLRGVQTGLVGLGVVAVVVALLAGFLIAERILAPVQKLVRAAEEMERGNYDHPIAIRSHDEIGYLAARFGDMRQQQRAYVNSLEEVARVKSEFISVASHELRTPISIVQGYQQLMRDGLLGPITSDQREALQAVGRSLADLTRIAEDATRMAQIQGARMVLSRDDHEVGEIVSAAIRAATSEAPNRRVAVRAVVEPGIGPVRVDGLRLVHALANLVRNGLRFTPDGGSVTVSASRRDGDLEIAVRDTGVGIPPEKQKHVFDRAFMVRESRNHHSSGSLEFNSAGLGLGLSIASGIIEAHGGTIRLESEVGRGSTFTVVIPLVQASAMEAAA
jgi:signal transduction histidine kinase